MNNQPEPKQQWQCYANEGKTQVVVGPANLRFFGMGDVGAFAEPIGGVHDDPRDACSSTMAQMTNDGCDMVNHSREGTPHEKVQRLIDGVSCFVLARALQELIYALDQETKAQQRILTSEIKPANLILPGQD